MHNSHVPIKHKENENDKDKDNDDRPREDPKRRRVNAEPVQKDVITSNIHSMINPTDESLSFKSEYEWNSFSSYEGRRSSQSTLIHSPSTSNQETRLPIGTPYSYYPQLPPLKPTTFFDRSPDPSSNYPRQPALPSVMQGIPIGIPILPSHNPQTDRPPHPYYGIPSSNQEQTPPQLYRPVNSSQSYGFPCTPIMSSSAPYSAYGSRKSSGNTEHENVPAHKESQQIPKLVTYVKSPSIIQFSPPSTKLEGGTTPYSYIHTNSRFRLLQEPNEEQRKSYAKENRCLLPNPLTICHRETLDQDSSLPKVLTGTVTVKLVDGEGSELPSNKQSVLQSLEGELCLPLNSKLKVRFSLKVMETSEGSLYRLLFTVLYKLATEEEMTEYILSRPFSVKSKKKKGGKKGQPTSQTSISAAETLTSFIPKSSYPTHPNPPQYHFQPQIGGSFEMKTPSEISNANVQLKKPKDRKKQDE